MNEALQTLPEERLDQSAGVSDEELMTVRDTLLHSVEHAVLHQEHLELTRQLLGYPPPENNEQNISSLHAVTT